MNQARTKLSFLREAWRLIYPYWLSSEALVAWMLTVVIVVLNLGLVYLTVLLNEWYGRFYTSLQRKNFEDFQNLLLAFCVLAFLYILGAVYRLYLQQMLEIKWRNWLTKSYITEWLAHRRFYLLQLKDFGSDNPDQRIAEDVRILASLTLSLSLGLLSSTTTLVSFFMILWNLSGPLSFEIFGTAVTVQGYMVWVAIIYALIGSVLTHYIGRALIKLSFNQQRFEADFRFSLIRVREHGESISLLRGEANEGQTLVEKFSHIISNWWMIMRYQKRLTWFTAAYSQIASIFPLVVGAPRYFRGAIELGALMQIASAFGRVQDALSWFIESYRPLTEWKASVDRLLGFRDAMAECDQILERSKSQLVRHSGNSVSGELSLHLPDSTPLRDRFSFSFEAGQRVLVSGKSGRGKSTFFRALSGLWPFAKGAFAMPDDAQVLFLPQKSYLPIASLRQVVLYPQIDSTESDERIISLLKAVELEKLCAELDTICDWSKRLSLGEQQRIAIIRALLKKPNWLFMDEATASLDAHSQKLVRDLVARELPHTATIAISHQEIQGVQGRLEF